MLSRADKSTSLLAGAGLAGCMAVCRTAAVCLMVTLQMVGSQQTQQTIWCMKREVYVQQFQVG